MVGMKVVSEYVGQSIVNNVVLFFFKKSCFFPGFQIFEYLNIFCVMNILLT